MPDRLVVLALSCSALLSLNVRCEGPPQGGTVVTIRSAIPPPPLLLPQEQETSEEYCKISADATNVRSRQELVKSYEARGSTEIASFHRDAIRVLSNQELGERLEPVLRPVACPGYDPESYERMFTALTSPKAVSSVVEEVRIVNEATDSLASTCEYWIERSAVILRAASRGVEGLSCSDKERSQRILIEMLSGHGIYPLSVGSASGTYSLLGNYYESQLDDAAASVAYERALKTASSETGFGLSPHSQDEIRERIGAIRRRIVR